MGLLFVFMQAGQKILIVWTPKMSFSTEVIFKGIVSLCHKNIAIILDFRFLYIIVRVAYPEKDPEKDL